MRTNYVKCVVGLFVVEDVVGRVVIAKTIFKNSDGFGGFMGGAASRTFIPSLSRPPGVAAPFNRLLNRDGLVESLYGAFRAVVPTYSIGVLRCRRCFFLPRLRFNLLTVFGGVVQFPAAASNASVCAWEMVGMSNRDRFVVL